MLYCDGSCVVTKEKHDEYDSDDIDEVDCPHCHGSGQKGFSGEPCGLCKGSCNVSRDKYKAYILKYGR